MQEREIVFLRKSSGLVRTWGFFDVFAFNSYANPMLGYYTSFVFLYSAFWPRGHLLPAIIISTFFATFQALTYSMLVSTMPRAGGEYVWMTRVFRYPVIGFVLVLVGWVFVVMLWNALLAPALAGLFLQPIALALGNVNLALWFMTRDGLFVSSLIFCFVPWLLITAGMKWDGRFIRSSYVLGGIVGFLIVAAVMFSYSQHDFVNLYNGFFSNTFGLSNAYQQVLDGFASWGHPYWPPPGEWEWDVAATLPLLALVAYANSWSMWGSPLYGEVKGAEELKVSFGSMGGSNIFNNVLTIIFLLAWYRLTGYSFFLASMGLYGSAVYGGYFDPVVPLWPSPTLFTYILTGSALLTLIVAVFGLYYIVVVHGMCCMYLPAIRMLFAMAFDRILPEPLARLYTRRRVPLVAFAVCSVLSIIYCILYFYVPGFITLTLLGTAVLILSFMGTCIAAILLPYKKPDFWKASPASKYRIGKVPLLVISAAITFLYFAYIIYWWAVDPTFGVNSPLSLMFFTVVYIGAIILYLFMKWYRKRQGIDITLAYKEIPVE